MDPITLLSVTQLSNDELLGRVKHLAERERTATVRLIACLAELDKRRLYLGEGCSSLFTYCTQILHLSEHAAYGRIAAARTVRKFPALLEMLEDGSVNLTTVVLLAAHLTSENYGEVVDMARYKCKREVLELVARLRPQPDVPASVRKLPTTRHNPTSPRPLQSASARLAAASLQPTGDARAVTPPSLPAPAIEPPSVPRAVVAPLAPERYKVQFTVDAETHKKLRFAQDLLRHQIPDGDPAKIFERALTALVRHLIKEKLAATQRAREGRGTVSGSRHIPATVKRAVWKRDEGRCAFISKKGRRCTEQGLVEFHHVAPYAVGGEPTVENIQLRCHAHNRYEAELYFGSRHPSGVRETRAIYLHSIVQQ